MESLKRIQQELKAPKNQYNNFGKYSYRSAEDILEAVKPLLLKYNAILTLSDSIEQIGGRIYVRAECRYSEGKECISVTAYAREPEAKKGMDESQITGTASSYARKYALNGLFLIDDTKDADTDEFRQQQNSSQGAPPPIQILCPKCGKPVKSAKGKDGTIHMPEQVLSECGGMCVDCYKAAKKRE